MLTKWSDAGHERDADGKLTPLALALDELSAAGCGCPLDEPGSCLACLCEAALRDLLERLRLLQDSVDYVATPLEPSLVEAMRRVNGGDE